jgi:hypothetical protein
LAAGAVMLAVGLVGLASPGPLSVLLSATGAVVAGWGASQTVQGWRSR